MKWFKHYSNAAENRKINDIMEEFTPDEGYAMFFKFLELCASTVGDGVIEVDQKLCISSTVLRRKLRKSTSKVDRFLHVCSTNDLLSWEKVDKFYKIKFPKLLELMGKDEKHRRKKFARKSLEEKREEEKRKEESSFSSFFSLPQSTTPLDEFVDYFGRDVTDKYWASASGFYEANQIKKPFGQFMFESLSRSVEKYGSQKSDQSKLQEAAKDLGLV